MAKKVSLKSNTVAYFDHPDHVDEPGFYLVDGENDETTEVNVYDGGSFATSGKDEGGNAVLEEDERGRPVFETAPKLKDVISVKHNSTGKPGKRVWPSPDGEGFVDEEPETISGQEDQWTTKGGEG